MDCPEPGVYHDVRYETYASWPAMRASVLVEGMKSMLALKAAIDGEKPDSDTDAMRFGRAVHCRLFEPDLFPTSFPQVERCVAMTKPAKKGDEPKPCRNLGRYIRGDGQWLCGQHAPDGTYEPRDYVTESEVSRIEKIRRRAMDHDELKHVRRYPGGEVSLVFDYLGVRCKCRCDKLIQGGGGFILDPKALGGEQFDEDAFAKEIAKRKYHVKAAMYLLGVKELLGLDAQFWWVFYQPQSPHDIGVVRMTETDRRIGTFEVRRVLDEYKRCLAADEWPGAFPGVLDHVGLSAWEVKKYACVEMSE